ncbi:hypothetical protein OG949_29510 [Streptomyces scopuliridis]|uniref:hypothetical protein n=1 Tax=Streptomyces scopuliridis TaxID=452529 RepID=UPI002DDC15D4|nr:hypothetical protein [Streptomyces scopuliridis]WSB36572.1 hypothetical protein OG949_29510 [Streptomyces scopuliridis]
MSDSMAGPAGQGSGERYERGPEERHEREPERETGAAGPGAPDPAAPRPLGLERVPTGDAEVDALLSRLADADHLPADGHVEVYEDVHRGLRDALTALDAQGPRGQPTPR